MSARRVNKWGGDATILGPAAGEPAPVGPRHRDASIATAVAAPLVTALPQGRWSRSPNVVFRSTLQGVMVLPPEGTAVVLSGVAAGVWEALTQPAMADQLAQRTSGAVDDVLEALHELQVMGAVREIR
jgi:hypothetical protein